MFLLPVTQAWPDLCPELTVLVHLAPGASLEHAWQSGQCVRPRDGCRRGHLSPLGKHAGSLVGDESLPLLPPVSAGGGGGGVGGFPVQLGAGLLFTIGCCCTDGADMAELRGLAAYSCLLLHPGCHHS